jgi:hypothetical protein
MVTTIVAIQPDADVYVMVAVPDATPVTLPEPELMVATEDDDELQVPPVVVVVSVPVPPVHIAVVPVIADGNPLTVTTVVVVQPVPSV